MPWPLGRIASIFHTLWPLESFLLCQHHDQIQVRSLWLYDPVPVTWIGCLQVNHASPTVKYHLPHSVSHFRTTRAWKRNVGSPLSHGSFDCWSVKLRVVHVGSIRDRLTWLDVCYRWSFSAFTFLLSFRANFSYNRVSFTDVVHNDIRLEFHLNMFSIYPCVNFKYWEAFGSVHAMHSKWLDGEFRDICVAFPATIPWYRMHRIHMKFCTAKAAPPFTPPFWSWNSLGSLSSPSSSLQFHQTTILWCPFTFDQPTKRAWTQWTNLSRNWKTNWWNNWQGNGN